ncbi:MULTISPECIES: EAL domain-containing protein [unclassified Herbaspirillum]|uniref:EAL domain-containing protein n=1 Tax=unclassified Herbaspirillum TaxID=2624150 RepID=UPI000C0B1CC0|nr:MULTISPECIES: EAL domain-containing protein [unclassified Herbaspirillum]MAF03357.1 diguanylate phosphodiesterase [Herbaspirillum sp.]MBO17146.1 diguanylate phosphodiesterase [Herbaspirillum sp.]|tara:strand:- start:322 stop:1116 length:795 start_codon:yes stop_codon:yes gene_type:complete
MIPLIPDSNASPGEDAARRSCEGCSDDGKLDIEFEYAYQPIVRLSTRAVYAYEALVRGPQGEPAYTVLEQVNDSNRYRFDQACRTKAVEGAARLGMTQFLSINFLPNAVYRPEVCIQSTFKAARKYDFPIERIIFEVTEGERVDFRPHLVNIFREYSRFGFRTAIDDFGAGYAGLNLLAEYQPDLIKIDMDLVRNIDTDKPRQAIVAGIAAICKELDIEILAEGVETRAERDHLAALGIDLMQGYWFAKPAFQTLAIVPTQAWD